MFPSGQQYGRKLLVTITAVSDSLSSKEKVQRHLKDQAEGFKWEVLLSGKSFLSHEVVSPRFQAQGAPRQLQPSLPGECQQGLSAASLQLWKPSSFEPFELDGETSRHSVIVVLEHPDKIYSLGNAKLFSHLWRRIWREPQEGGRRPGTSAAGWDWGSQSSFPPAATSYESHFLFLLRYLLSAARERRGYWQSPTCQATWK